MIIWDSRFEIGVAELDEQHRIFVSKVNELGRLTRATNPTVEEARFVIELVQYIEDYAAGHFRKEEECMARFKCPMHEINKRAHQLFLEDYRRFKQRWFDDGYSTALLGELHKMTSGWVQKHILGVDRELRHFVKKTSRPEELV
jgi:hemerythrin